jgi:hypothetical protein
MPQDGTPLWKYIVSSLGGLVAVALLLGGGLTMWGDSKYLRRSDAKAFVGEVCDARCMAKQSGEEMNRRLNDLNLELKERFGKVESGQKGIEASQLRLENGQQQLLDAILRFQARPPRRSEPLQGNASVSR